MEVTYIQPPILFVFNCPTKQSKPLSPLGSLRAAIHTVFIMEAIFKALAKALDQATTLEERLAGKVLSTKGML